MSLRWTWAAAPDGSVLELAQRLESGWTPGADGLLKAGAGRRVWRVPDAGDGLLLKHFVVPARRRWLHLVRASRAAAEYRAAHGYAAAGVPTAPALGFGERRVAGLLREAYFVGRFLPDTVALGAWMRDESDAGRCDAVLDAARSALSLAAAMHRAPWRHRDLHADNILRAPDGTLTLIDLHSAWRVSRVTRAVRLENLARLLYSFRRALDLRAAPELLAYYAREAGQPERALVADGLDALDRFELDYVRGRTARCVKRSTLFDNARHADGRLFHRRGYAAQQLERDLAAHGAALERGGADVLGSAPRARVTRVTDGDGGRVLKEYPATGPIAALRQALGRGRPRSAWLAARRLDVLDIPTPEALALLERSDGSAVLVSRELTDAQTLRQLAEASARSLGLRDRVDVAVQVGWLVARLARSGVRHDDLSTKNILLLRAPPAPVRDVRDRPTDGAWRAVLIDLDNLRSMPRFDAAGLIRMLAQLFDVPDGITRSDRLRFLIAYARAAGQALPEAVGAAALAGAAVRARRRQARSRPQPTGAASLGGRGAPATGVNE